MQVAIFLSIAVLQWTRFHPDFVSLFTPFEFRYSEEEFQDELIRYRLFIPEPAGPGERMPLIVWLHGAGEAGTGNLNQLRWLDHLIFAPPWRRADYPFFVLAVNCAPENPVWTRTARAQGYDMIDVVRAVVDEVLQKYPVDRERIYVSGVSSGGSGCWQLALRYPEYFAAVAPLASAGAGTANLERLASVPVWAFHCARDEGTPVELVRTTIAALREAGGNAHLTEVDSASHDAWNPAFRDYHLLDWLLAQRRGAEGPPPGNLSMATRLADFAAAWRWWQVVVQIGILLLFAALAWSVIRARRRRTDASRAKQQETAA